MALAWASDAAEVVWPPLLFGEKATIAALVDRLGETECLARAEIESAQGTQLARLVAHHATHTPAFARRLASAGLQAADIDRIGALGLLEPLSRRELQSAGAAGFARRLPKRHEPAGETKTSGSTGEPVTVRRTAINRLFWAAFTIRNHLWHRRDFAGRLTSIRPTIASYAEGSDWGFPVADLFRTGRAQGIPSTFAIERQLSLIERFRPETLIVFPSALQAFVTHWERSGMGVPAGLLHLRTIGETVPDGLRERLAALGGATIEDSYSSQECGSIAVQCPASGLYHTMAESLVVEVLDEAGEACAEGRLGRVVVTDLQNFATPLIRYDIGDYAEAGGACPCGRGLPTLRRILGRRRNLIVRPDGSRHWPQVGFHRFEEAAPVLQYQVIQHAALDVELKVVTAEELSGAQTDRLGQIVTAALDWPRAVRVTQQRERLAGSTGGKFEEFVCRMADEHDAARLR